MPAKGKLVGRSKSGVPRYQNQGYKGGVKGMVKDAVDVFAYAVAPAPLKRRKKVIDRASNY